MPYERNLSPEHPLVREVARMTHRSKAKVASMHPMGIYDLWAEHCGYWGGSLDIIHQMLDGWPMAKGYATPHDDHFLDGERVPGGRWLGFDHLLKSHSLEEICAMDAQTAWMEIATGYYKYPLDAAAAMWHASVRVIRDSGLTFLDVDTLTAEKFAGALSQAGFDGVLISKED
jgi:hypothetical protein